MDIDNIEINDLKNNLNRILSDKIIAIERNFCNNLFNW
ncbi:hypothetical protein RC62_2603 [Flavobacterium aquidurense]|uniref:Uncharacterized protein n=1 Tax=Flavobacterium aquidurense TaxID=362413 RepID=A0A0Q0VZU4_9FLAO|nr:hypothetical protein RC62_2603 [Flavobacterium aquidurense]